MINASFGFSENPPILADAAAYVATRNVLIVAAAGNDNRSRPDYPAAYPEVLAVGASTPDDKRWWLSNYGEGLDVVAPGGGHRGGDDACSTSDVNILTVRQKNLPGCTAFSPTLLRFAATSAATPHVTGLAGLLFTQNPTWTAKQVHDRIIATADDIGPRGKDLETGYGRINAARALGVSSEPPACPGDFNHDGTVDIADYVVWRNSGGSVTDYNLWRANYGRTCTTAAQSASRSPVQPSPSPTPSRTATPTPTPVQSSTPLPVSAASTCTGDYNRDRVVNGDDYGVWVESQGQTVPRGSGADGNRDGRITTSDYRIWQNNLGRRC
jgi:subtilisin family serine protease